MQKVTLGKEGPKVARLGLSCGHGAGRDAAAILRAAWDGGLNLIDARDFEAAGQGEKLVLPGRRKDAVVLGGYAGSQHGPAQVAEACDAALVRLGLDSFDVFVQHDLDADVPIEDSMGAMARLIEAGKVRHLGLSDVSCQTLRRAHAVHALAAVQWDYALWHREAEVELLATLRGLNVALLAKQPSSDAWAKEGAVAARNAARHPELVHVLQQVAQHSKASLAQLALAWLLAQGNDVVPLVEARRVADVQEHVQALQLRLTPTILDKLDLTFHLTATRQQGATAGS